MRRKNPFGKKLLVTLLLLIVLVGGTAIILPGLLLDANKFKEIAAAQVEAATGRKLNVKGAAKFTLFPSPVLHLQNIELDPGSDDSKPIPRLRAESISIEIPFGNLFSQVPVPRSVTLAQPVLEIERAADGEIYWDWLSMSKGGGALPGALDIRGGKIIYFNPFNEKRVRFDEIHLHVGRNEAGEVSAGGKFSYLERQVNISAVLPPATGGGASSIAIKVWQSDNTQLTAQLEHVPAEAGKENAKSTWRGEMLAQVEDLNAWLPQEEKKPANPAADVLGQVAPEAASPREPYPVKIAGKVEYSGGLISLPEMELETKDSAGKGEAAMNLSGVPGVNIRMVFERLKLHPEVFARYMGRSSAEEQAEIGAVAAAESEPRIPKGIFVHFDLAAENMFVNAHQFNGVTLAGDLQNGELIIENLKGSFAGDTVISLSGKVVDTARGMRFQGKTETSGKNLRAVLSTLERGAEQLPEKAFSEYYIEANIFISSEQLRLSEAQIKLGDLQLIGGLVTYFEETPRVEAEIALRDTNLDYFRDAWREEIKKNGSHDFIFKVNSNVDFGWLRALKPIIDLKLNFERFTFLEKTGDFASFRLYARTNEIGMHKIEMRYPEGLLRGDVRVSVNGPMPQLDINLDVPEFNTSYLSEDGEAYGEPWVNPGEGEGRWSKRVFDFGWMIGVSSKINLAARRVIHQDENYDRFQLQGALANEQLQISKLTFERYGGKIDLTGTLVGGKVPGLTMSYTVFNADIAQLLKSYFGIDKLTGRASLSGSVVTSGINFHEWVKQADAKIVLAARGVRAERFNLQGVVDGVLAARSVADVVSNVEKALPASSTDFSVDGNINISQGVVRTPGITLQPAGGIALGNLSGELLLIPWKMALNMLFQMNTLQSETVPTLAVDLAGTPDKYEMRLDTSSLEAFVAKRVVGR